MESFLKSNRSFLLCLGSIAAGTVLLTLLWTHHQFADQEIWTIRTQHMIEDYKAGIEHISQDRYSGHPGMAALQVAAVIAFIFHIPAAVSLVVAVSLMVSSTATTIGYACYRIHPHAWWWLPATTTVMFHHLYSQSSPTNAVVAPLVVLGLLVAYRISVQHPSSHLLAAMLGIVMGAAIATRFPTGVFFFGCMLFYLALTIRWRMLVLIFGIAGIATAVFDPLFLYAPVTHLHFILYRTELHMFQLDEINLQLIDFVTFAPGTVLSILLTVVLLVSRRISPPLLKPFLVFMLVVTLVMSAIVVHAHSSSLRYFFPIIFWWDTLLPLIPIIYTQYVHWPSEISQRFNVQSMAPKIIAVFFACLPILSMIYAFLL